MTQLADGQKVTIQTDQLVQVYIADDEMRKQLLNSGYEIFVLEVEQGRYWPVEVDKEIPNIEEVPAANVIHEVARVLPKTSEDTLRKFIDENVLYHIKNRRKWMTVDNVNVVLRQYVSSEDDKSDILFNLFED